MEGEVGRLFFVMMSLVTAGLVAYLGIRLVNMLPTGRREPDRLQPDEVELVRNQIGEVEELKARVAELEERVDFSERLLAQQSQDDTIPTPPS